MPPPNMKTFDISGSGVKIDVAAIDWPANTTALVYENRDLGGGTCKSGGALVCHTTDPDESKEGAETSEIRITCNADQVIGDIGKIVFPEGMQSVNFARCRDLAGTADS